MTINRLRPSNLGYRLAPCLSLVYTGEISTSTNSRHTHAQNQSSTNQAVYTRAYASYLCLRLCLSHQCEPGFKYCEIGSVCFIIANPQCAETLTQTLVIAARSRRQQTPSPTQILVIAARSRRLGKIRLAAFASLGWNYSMFRQFAVLKLSFRLIAT